MKALNLELQICPICGGNIIEDAWEDLQEQEDGKFFIDAYPAYVCEKHCGYVKRINDAPNLFQFATSELSQDAFLCWLFEHIRFSRDDIAKRIAIDLLEKIIVEYINFHPSNTLDKLKNYYLVNVEQQVKNIDILLTLKSTRYDENIYIVIEDKVDSGENRKNQPEYYSKKLKKRDPESIVIPVLLKTGYVTEEQRREYEKRKVVFIGYEDIYNLFITHVHHLNENIILQTWWENFHEKYYRSIEAAKSLEIDQQSTLRQFNRLCKVQGFPDKLAFQVITDYLFGDIQYLEWKRQRIQGIGHADWKFEFKNPLWRNKNRKIRVNLNFEWDQQTYSFVIKTAPIPYKPQTRLSKTEKEKYTAAQKLIKSEIKNNKLDDWKITNYYLCIAKMMHIQDMPLGELKEKMKEDVEYLTEKLDEIMKD